MGSIEDQSVMSETSKFHTTANGTEAHYVQCGNPKGQLLLTLHGLGGSTNTFSPLLSRLPLNRFNVVSIDLEGLGKTKLTHPDLPLSIKRYVEDFTDMLAFLQRNDIENGKIIIFGHSLGSIIALHYASSQPENVEGMCLLGVGRSASHIPAARDRMNDLAKKTRAEGIKAAALLAMQTNFPTEGVSNGTREEVRAAVAASDAEGYARTAEALASAEHKDPDYSKVACPLLFISGAQDPLSPPDRARDISRVVSGSAKVAIVGQGHQPILEDLDGVDKAIAQFLDQIL